MGHQDFTKAEVIPSSGSTLTSPVASPDASSQKLDGGPQLPAVVSRTQGEPTQGGVPRRCAVPMEDV
ncbi:unnamed protein product [Lota lota]